MGSLGFPELLIILLIVVVIFGATRLPQIGDGLGRAIKNFKKASSSADEIDVTPKKEIPPTDSPKAPEAAQK